MNIKVIINPVLARVSIRTSHKYSLFKIML